MTFDPKDQRPAGGDARGPDTVEALPGVAQGATKKNACGQCGDILSANALTCEFCGHIVNRVRPARPASLTGASPEGSPLNEPAPTWDLRGGCYLLDNMISVPLGIIPFGGLLYVLLKDGINNGQSPGKSAGSMRVVDAVTGAPATMGQSFGRNFILIVPFMVFIEAFLVWKDGVRLGDKIAGTRVIRPRSAGPCPKWGLALIAFSVFCLFALIMVIAAIAVPAFSGARERANERACFANQKTMTGAMEMYRLDKNVPAEQKPEINPAMLEELKKGGYLQSVPTDPGQGPGTGFHYVMDEEGRVVCTVHGSFATSSSSRGQRTRRR